MQNKERWPDVHFKLPAIGDGSGRPDNVYMFILRPRGFSTSVEHWDVAGIATAADRLQALATEQKAKDDSAGVNLASLGIIADDPQKHTSPMWGEEASLLPDHPGMSHWPARVELT